MPSSSLHSWYGLPMRTSQRSLVISSKFRILDGLGCAISALNGEPIRLLRRQIEEFDGGEHCTLIGGGKTAPDRAALYNSALVRYLDFNDSYLAKGETCHPSGHIAAGPP